MADVVLDMFTLFGPVPPRPGEHGVEPLLAVLQKHGVAGAVTLSTRGLYYSASAGNRETIHLCTQAGGALLPACVLDPRQPQVLQTIMGAKMLCLLPATQKWPMLYAPLTDMLRAVAQSPDAANLPLWIEVSRPGDGTALAAELRETGYSGPVIMGSVIGENLIEAIAVARADNRVFIATDGLRGIGEIAAAVGAIGASRVVFASGAPVQALGAALAMVAAAEISDSDREAILNGNARRLLSGRNATA